jgi:hypothetical protein
MTNLHNQWYHWCLGCFKGKTCRIELMNPFRVVAKGVDYMELWMWNVFFAPPLRPGQKQ